ncbi:LacI family DNA-binding transcriptional regulator [Levilactobacillus brevis]|uniref:LacI family DNA-binding transcriptional regulator n=1 Tax=Levilactobacillus brevis TaxID=1580 RepID=UPI00374E9F18
MTVTIKDVAKQANLSSTTVSRVLNNRGYLSDKTKKKVYDAMKALNYYPNSVARSLNGKQMGLIGLIFPQISNVFYAELIESIETRLFNKGYKAIVCDSFNNQEKENSYLTMLQENKVDGIITGSHNENLQRYKEINLPIVAFDRYLGKKIPTVSSDNFGGGQAIAKKLLDLKATKLLGFFTDIEDVAPTKDRLLGLEEQLQNTLIDYRIINIPSLATDKTRQMLMERSIYEFMPDAIVASDDIMALFIQQIFHTYIENNRVKILGYDGTLLIRRIHPELLTVVQPIPDIADLLVNLLLDKIEGKNNFESKQYILPIKFHG